MTTPLLSFRCPDEIVAQLEARGEKSGVNRDSLDRYFALLDIGRAALRDRFTEGEIALILNASNGTRYQPWSIPHMGAGIEDAVHLDHLDEKWSVNGPALISKLRALTTAERFALVNAAERFWLRVSRGEKPEHAEALK